MRSQSQRNFCNAAPSYINIWYFEFTGQVPCRAVRCDDEQHPAAVGRVHVPVRVPPRLVSRNGGGIDFVYLRSGTTTPGRHNGDQVNVHKVKKNAAPCLNSNALLVCRYQRIVKKNVDDCHTDATKADMNPDSACASQELAQRRLTTVQRPASTITPYGSLPQQASKNVAQGSFRIARV